MKVKIKNTIYEVIATILPEVCILQTFDYADGTKRQVKIWTDEYILVSEND